MKRTPPSQASRVPTGSPFAATQRHDGEANLLARRNCIAINLLGKGNGNYRNRWNGLGKELNVFAVHGVDETGKPALVRPELPRG